MRLRLLAACAATLILAGLAPAQTYYPYSTSPGGSAGQTLGHPDHLFHPAVRVAGAVEPLPEPAGWYGFAYTVSASATVAGGLEYTPGGRLAAVWVHDGAGWLPHRTLDVTAALPVYFAFPTAALDTGDVLLQGVGYDGRTRTYLWAADGSVY